VVGIFGRRAARLAPPREPWVDAPPCGDAALSPRFVRDRWRLFRFAPLAWDEPRPPLADPLAWVRWAPLFFGCSFGAAPLADGAGLRRGRRRRRRFRDAPERAFASCHAGVPVGSSPAMTCGY